MKYFVLPFVLIVAFGNSIAGQVVGRIYTDDREIDVLQFQPYGKQPTGSTSICYSDRVKVRLDDETAVFPVEELEFIEKRHSNSYEVGLRDGRVLVVEKVYGTLCEGSTARPSKQREGFEIYYMNTLSQKLDRMTVENFNRVEFYR